MKNRGIIIVGSRSGKTELAIKQITEMANSMGVNFSECTKKVSDSVDAFQEQKRKNDGWEEVGKRVSEAAKKAGTSIEQLSKILDDLKKNDQILINEKSLGSHIPKHVMDKRKKWK